jgi:acetate kinase
MTSGGGERPVGRSGSPCVLSINGGSSSLKFAVYTVAGDLTRRLYGKIDRIGTPDAVLTLSDAGKESAKEAVKASDHASAAAAIMERLARLLGADAIAAIGHRVVHGGPKYREPQLITPEVLDELRRVSPYDPEHLPAEIRLIEAFAGRYPGLPQVACFDTAFHRDMPRAARLLPIPRRFEAKGVYRYGFHGLSYAYLMEELTRVVGRETANGRVILAHLGNGASLAAVRQGKCIDTSMAFTPAAGLPMSTRSGDLDPGLVWYLARSERMTAEEFNRMVNQESGLFGVSETGSDMRDLLAREADDVRAAEAVELFCYQTKKWIGGFAAALGGLDTLVFAGGIGENAAVVRERICAGLGFLGIELEPARNQTGAALISSDRSSVTVRVMRTDEEIMIARAVCRKIGFSKES